MATTAEIRKHQQQMDRLISEFEQELGEQLERAFDSVAALGTGATRTEVQAIFQTVKSWADAQGSRLESIVQGNIDMNASVLGTDINQQILTNLAQVKEQLIAQVQTQIEQEQNRVIQTIVLAGVAGAVSNDLISQTRGIRKGSKNRISTVFVNAVYQFDAIITRARSPKTGEQKYQYVGGIIASTRDFCAQHDGAIYTEKEIREIWRSTWSGQEPGDPFVVRGGYNCRHTWVAVEE